jgi:hypothetical protein
MQLLKLHTAARLMLVNSIHEFLPRSTVAVRQNADKGLSLKYIVPGHLISVCAACDCSSEVISLWQGDRPCGDTSTSPFLDVLEA